MIEIEFPATNFRIKQEKGKDIIFDAQRKQWITLTPEEWVRQNFIQYLVQTKGYPPSLLAVEREISVGELKKRFDIVVYRNAKPWLIVECKEMNVQLSEATLKQVLNYNIKLQVEYIVITNGKSTFAVQVDSGHHHWLNEIPAFN